MKIHFQKYQGTGNDFVMIDDRNETFDLQNENLIAKLCDRKFGIGADGLILLRHDPNSDFRMIYFNSDGKPSSFCGNGGRCTVKFAESVGMFQGKTKFLANDGMHEAYLQDSQIFLKMADVKQIEIQTNDFFLNTGSPHNIIFVENIENFDVFSEGQKIRYSPRFEKEGSNINFVEKNKDHIFVRTYERGVEDETLSCGTGVTAAALATALQFKTASPVHIQTLGGNLRVAFKQVSQQHFEDIYLIGAAQKVFEGSIEV
ncbi:MAG: diaminopimelate epimerase [Bacteroidetes bacterium]|nr:MAG: diaminopimelate epimerase [Bacteroidota bacterium]